MENLKIKDEKKTKEENVNQKRSTKLTSRQKAALKIKKSIDD